MTCHRLRRFAIAWLALLLLAVSADAKDRWLRMQTKNFSLISNASEGETRNLAFKLEQFRGSFLKVYALQDAAAMPVTVIVFKSDSSFKPFKPLYDGKPATLAGFFQRGDDENLIVLGISGRSGYQYRTIFHEYTHFLTARTARPWPIWLTEGIAELFSTFEVERNDMIVGAPIDSHVFLLREKRFLPLGTLFSVTHGSPEYSERDKKGLFYAQSWALVHYLMYGNKSEKYPQLVRFIRLLDTNLGLERSFQEAFGMGFEQMERELRRYIGNDSYPAVRYTLDSTDYAKEASTEPLADAELQYHLGYLLMRINRMEEAEPFFRKAIEMDPNMAAGHEGLGMLALRRGKYDEAMEHFKNGVSRNSTNFLAHFYYAESLRHEAVREGRLLEAEAAQPIIEALRSAIRLRPEFAPAHYNLAAISLNSGAGLEAGMKSARKAAELEPQNGAFMLLVADFQVRLEQYADARKTLEGVLASTPAGSVKRSAESLMQLIETIERRASEPVLREEVRGEAIVEARAPEPRTRREGPTLKRPGTTVVRGDLIAIECPSGGMVLVARVDGKLVRYVVRDVPQLEFYTQDPGVDDAIGCGPVGRPAFFFIKPLEGKSAFAGDAVAVEFFSSDSQR